MPPTVLFVCLHGSAKSVIAARHFEHLAAARGIRVDSASAGVEPDATVPSHVIQGLRSDGLDVPPNPPTQVTTELVSNAACVVAFGCDLSALSPRRDVIHWDDVPAVSDGYPEARDAIVARVQSLLDELPASAISTRGTD